MVKGNASKLAEEVKVNTRYDMTYRNIHEILEAADGSTSEAILLAFKFGYLQGGKAEKAKHVAKREATS